MYETGTTWGSPFCDAVANLHSSLLFRKSISLVDSLTPTLPPVGFLDKGFHPKLGLYYLRASERVPAEEENHMQGIRVLLRDLLEQHSRSCLKMPETSRWPPSESINRDRSALWDRLSCSMALSIMILAYRRICIYSPGNPPQAYKR